MSVVARVSNRLNCSTLFNSIEALSSSHSSRILVRFYSSEGETDQTDSRPERTFFKNPEIIDGFRVFDTYMNKKRDGMTQRTARSAPTKIEVDMFARYQKMSVDQDWTNVWPTASGFKSNAIPLPIRQGFIKNPSENNGLPPVKYANTELMKIPNFFHLTPPHIKKHCAAIKKFCTAWPTELKTDEDCEKHFPLEITTSSYIYDGPTIRDDRARVVTLQIKVSSLDLDERARDKLTKLAQERYDEKSDVLTIVADRCPYRKQNEDYANYLLTTLYHESKEVEEWEEEEMSEEDRPRYVWEKTKSKQNILQTLCKIEKTEMSEETLIKSDKVREYKENLSKLFDQGESSTNIGDYKSSVLSMLNLKSKSLKA